jgi:hypothetical protein
MRFPFIIRPGAIKIVSQTRRLPARTVYNNCKKREKRTNPFSEFCQRDLAFLTFEKKGFLRIHGLIPCHAHLIRVDADLRAREFSSPAGIKRFISGHPHKRIYRMFPAPGKGYCIRVVFVKPARPADFIGGQKSGGFLHGN